MKAVDDMFGIDVPRAGGGIAEQSALIKKQQLDADAVERGMVTAKSGASGLLAYVDNDDETSQSRFGAALAKLLGGAR